MLSKALLRHQIPTIANSINLPVCFFVSIFAGYAAYSRFIYPQHLAGDRAFFVYAVVAAIALSGVRVSYAQATASFRILLRSIIAFAVFYIVTCHVDIAPDLLVDKPLAAFELNYLWVATALCGLVAMVRPSFGVIPLLYVLWQKQQWMSVFSTPIEWMDYVTLLETGGFLILSYLLLALFRRLGMESPLDLFGKIRSSANADGTISPFHPVDMLVLFAIALHFGNYFYAGMIKATLGDSPIDWVLNNRTELLVLAAWNNGVLPVSFHAALPPLTYELIANVRVVTNSFTIAIQMLAVVAILRIRWAIAVTLCYDLLHLVIFVTTGIFFWKFILLNLAIVAALSVIGMREIPRRMKYALASTVVCSPLIFTILPSFAWLDTPSVNHVQLYAVTEDGAEFPVPTSYFLGASVNLAQDRLVWPAKGPFPTETWGTTRDNTIAKAAQHCDWQRTDDAFLRSPFGLPREAIEAMVRRNHVQILSMADENGHVDYDLFPHHIFSMPWLFRDFKRLDKRRIVAYRYESQAVCLGYDDGRLTRQVKYSATFDIPL